MWTPLGDRRSVWRMLPRLRLGEGESKGDASSRVGRLHIAGGGQFCHQDQAQTQAAVRSLRFHSNPEVADLDNQRTVFDATCEVESALGMVRVRMAGDIRGGLRNGERDVTGLILGCSMAAA